MAATTNAQAATAAPTTDVVEDNEKLEKEYQETKHVPRGYTRRLETLNSETKPVYRKIVKK